MTKNNNAFQFNSVFSSLLVAKMQSARAKNGYQACPCSVNNSSGCLQIFVPRCSKESIIGLQTGFTCDLLVI